MTWGCQMNEEDSEQMALYLEQMGYVPVDNPAEAEIVLLNTCSVRRKPEEKVYSKLGELRELKRRKPEMIIGVCGCMAQVESREIMQRAPFVDLIVGTGNLAAIPNLIRALREDSGKREEEITRGGIPRSPLLSLDLPPRKGAIVTEVPIRNIQRKPKLKAHVPIMYGCDKFCTFCIVPLTRGRERSRPTADILLEINALARTGTKEVTLLGQTVNSYGKNLAEGRVPFARLLEMIDAIRGIQRIRFTSPYPRDFTDDLIETMARLPKVCEHVHLPLQVADDALLQRMHRGYTVDKYREIVEKLRAAMPGIAITTDLMLGFPGETDEQFRNTLRFVEEIRFDAAFMFAYSPRPGTKAAEMPDQVPHEVKIARLNELIALQNRITVEKNRALVGQTFEVLVEGRSPKDPTKLTGLTRTFKTVNFPPPEEDTRPADSLIGKLVMVRAVEGHLWGFTGELVDGPSEQCNAL
ncbi:MAG TPA: tRNA (N6-isopentenyl adenosine(37)-C2)-methylthiotransferase MiaB [Chthonomonadales bacterium]|nr:tRNA (N6-isopentenyl adenosine(37)-C2)-methylthiotransferase MiaB [Chthonomonadales bacterium]